MRIDPIYRVAIALSSLVVSSGTARGVTPLWGTSTSASISDLRASGGQSNSTVLFNGNEGQPLSAVDVDDLVLPDAFGDGPWNRGRARSFAGLNFTQNAPPVLSAEARLTGNTSNRFEFGSFPVGATAFAQSFASDIFQYTGSQPTTLGLTYNLDADVSNDPTDVSGQTYAYAQIGVFSDVDYAFYPDLDTLIFEFGAHPLQHNGVDAIDSSSMLITHDTGGLVETRTATVQFDVVPGQVFYVFAKMGAGAAGDARHADAYNTLSGAFSDPGSVVSLSVPAPGPGSLLGLCVAACSRRRRRHF